MLFFSEIAKARTEAMWQLVSKKGSRSLIIHTRARNMVTRMKQNNSFFHVVQYRLNQNENRPTSFCEKFLWKIFVANSRQSQVIHLSSDLPKLAVWIPIFSVTCSCPTSSKQAKQIMKLQHPLNVKNYVWFKMVFLNYRIWKTFFLNKRLNICHCVEHWSKVI